MRMEDLKEIVRKFALDLSGLVVFTEAATGIYAYTSVIAALAGAEQVYAYAKHSDYGSRWEATAAVRKISEGLNLNNVEVVSNKNPYVGMADIVTNSGHVRPINKDMIDAMKPSAIICLMFEQWEYKYRPSDVDMVEWDEKRNIPVVPIADESLLFDNFLFQKLFRLRMWIYKRILHRTFRIKRGRFVLELYALGLKEGMNYRENRSIRHNT